MISIETALSRLIPGLNGNPRPRRWSAAQAPVIISLLDIELCRLMTMQALLHQHAQVHVEYAFRCQHPCELPPGVLKAELEDQLDELCTLRFSAAELAYLARVPSLHPGFIGFLEGFRLPRQCVAVTASQDGGLAIRVAGPVLHCLPFGTYLPALLGEVYSRQFLLAPALVAGRERLLGKLDRLRRFARAPQRRFPFAWFEAGTRHRYARSWQEEVVFALTQAGFGAVNGTTNLYLAMRHGLQPIGGMAPEYLGLFQGLAPAPEDAQRQALEHWVRQYRGDAGVAGGGSGTVEAFLAGFDRYFCKLFDGLCHEAGDPIAWGERVIAHWRAQGVDPAGKTLVFAQVATLERAFTLYHTFADRIPVRLGVGADLVHDCAQAPLHGELALLGCNGRMVAA
ncbi:nicotinate phosphoribosyltransferase [Chitiniphilus purpureus]|uniref:nicotinate phosphoribosyltransferase n=1 Tax=Chitiniphilus purpureus TaxID=2981137 RepID=A0ABY6DLZ8_9NEIS|nr:nicotinate phosphoribosyltransferase [Chitiniphilus sp. CD1]UXY15376.1 nicotinate phosphoribosyltransferase [Chitiniphilus sp. CD1]